MLHVKETKQNYVSFDGLQSNTAYELKVFTKTYVGINAEHFLLIGFTTKHDGKLRHRYIYTCTNAHAVFNCKNCY